MAEEKEEDSKKEMDKYVRGIIYGNLGIVCKLTTKATSNFVGREDEIEAVTETLMKERMRNCILVGKAGVGKTEIVRKACQNLKNGDVVLSLDVTALQAGCTYVGMIEKRTNNIVKSIVSWNDKHENKIILFIDEIHVLATVGKNDFSGSVAVSNTIKPYLSDGTLIIIGATTLEEYDKYIKADKALMRRLPPIYVNEMEHSSIASVIYKFGKKRISKDLCEYIFEKSKEISYLQNPDCSLEIADRTIARAKYHSRNEVEKEDIDISVKMMKRI